MHFVPDSRQDVGQEPRTARLDSPQKAGAKDSEMVSSSVKSHPRQPHAISDDFLDVLEPAAATIRPTDRKIAHLPAGKMITC